METSSVLPYHTIIALDLANAHIRDLERAAARHRMAAEAGEARHRPTVRRSGRVGAIVARPLRAFSNASQSVADAACTVATRLDGRSA
jgi:hypothetical protein